MRQALKLLNERGLVLHEERVRVLERPLPERPVGRACPGRGLMGVGGWVDSVPVYVAGPPSLYNTYTYQ